MSQSKDKKFPKTNFRNERFSAAWRLEPNPCLTPAINLGNAFRRGVHGGAIVKAMGAISDGTCTGESGPLSDYLRRSGYCLISQRATRPTASKNISNCLAFNKERYLTA